MNSKTDSKPLSAEQVTKILNVISRHVENSTIPTVCELRRAKYRVRVTHSRWYYMMAFSKVIKVLIGDAKAREIFSKMERLNYLQPKGGQTVVEIRSPLGKEVVGIANCSFSDAFNRQTGLDLALRRAWEQL